MPLESATYISDLDPSNPVGSSDLVSSLDDHMRLVKATLQTTFPGIAGAVTATHVELNHLDGVTGTTGTGKLVLDDAPTIANLTVTDSITLPANSVADAALSDNIMRKDVANVCPAQDPIVGSHPTDTVIRRADNTGAIRIYPGNSLAGASGNARLFLFSGSHPDTPGAATLAALGNGVLTLQSSGGITLNGNANISGTSHFESTARSVSAPAVRIGESGNTNTPGVLSVITASNPNLVLFNSTSEAEGLFQVGTSVLIGAETAHTLSFRTNATSRMSIDAAGDVSMTGALSVGGAVRAGTAATSTSATLAAGQIHHRSANTTVPSMNAGQWVAVQNTSTSSITLSQGSGVTLELAGTTTTGNRTLAAKGFAFIYFRANGVGVCGGAGVS